MKERIGFVGLGMMGAPMSRNLLKAGHEVAVFDVDASRIEEIADVGARAAESPADAASGADVTITMVPDSQDVEAAIAGTRGIIEGAGRGSVVVDMSTISPATSRTLAARLAERGVDMLDAPVSGGVIGAQNAALTIFVGGDTATFERCLPVLKVMGRAVTHMGPSGAGHTAKLANQILGAGCMIGVAEGLVFAKKAGLDLKTFVEAAMQGAAASWTLGNQAPRVMDGDFSPGFMVKHIQKDLRLAHEVGGDVGVVMPMAGIVQQLYRALQAEGDQELGHHAIVRVIEKLSQAEARG
ncbi:MAG: NAD(P)-dependent oxidoreductase [Chloroflexi bacterium]|nr:NAD(P)-dependent oxidoreductase [Chloroflexota bacterium]